MGETDFWDNQEAAKSVVGEVKILKTQIEPMENVMSAIADVKAMYELASEADDRATMEECDAMLVDVEAQAQKVELQAVLDGKNDPRNCFVSIQAGAGGTEAQDWARDALAYVPVLLPAARLGRLRARSPIWRAGRYQERHLSRGRRICVRLHEGRSRRPPPGPSEPVQRSEQAADLLRIRGRGPGVS